MWWFLRRRWKWLLVYRFLVVVVMVEKMEWRYDVPWKGLVLMAVKMRECSLRDFEVAKWGGIIEFHVVL